MPEDRRKDILRQAIGLPKLVRKEAKNISVDFVSKLTLTALYKCPVSTYPDVNYLPMRTPGAHRVSTGSRCLQLLMLVLLGHLYLQELIWYRKGESLRFDLHFRQAFRSRKLQIQHLLSRGVSRLHADDDAGAPYLITSVVAGTQYTSLTYVVDLSIGTPPRELHFVLDTGSGMLWTQCQPCEDCYQQLSPVFQPNQSSSYLPVPCTSLLCYDQDPQPVACSIPNPPSCRFNTTYEDGSRSVGTLSTDAVTLPSGRGRGSRFPGIAFGCGHSNGGTFGQADGVLGLGPGPLSLWRQIGSKYGRKFAYCLPDFTERPWVKSVLVFGQDSDRILQKKLSTPADEMQYTAMVYHPWGRAAPPNYYVTILAIAVNDQVLPIDPELFQINADGSGGTIFDSGTTMTYFVPLVYREVYRALEMAIRYPVKNLDADMNDGADDGRLHKCFHAPGPLSELKDLPLLSIVFPEGSVFTPQVNSMYLDAGNGIKCLTIYERLSSSRGLNTIGNVFQQNFLMVHDSSKRSIGFARTDCSSLS